MFVRSVASWVMESKRVGLVYCRKCEAEYLVWYNSCTEQNEYDCKMERMVLDESLREGRVFYYD